MIKMSCFILYHFQNWILKVMWRFFMEGGGTMHLLFFFFLQEFKIGHKFASWQCLATCCQDDNAWPPHVARMALQKLTDLGYEILLHPLYFSDILPTDYYFFQASGHFYAKKHFVSKEK